MLSLSLLDELRDSHENGLVSFLPGGGGGAAAVVGAGAGGGGCMAAVGGLGLRDGDSAGGDHGIDGRALVMLLNEMVLLGCSFSTGLFGSKEVSVLWDALKFSLANAGWRGPLPSAALGASSSKLTLSRFDVLEKRFERGDELRGELSSTPVTGTSVSGFCCRLSSDVVVSGLLVSVASTSSSFFVIASLSSSLTLSFDAGLATETDRLVRERTEPVSTASSKVS